MISANTLPLLYKTSDAWARAVLKGAGELLNDHVHLEKKAAINAMGLLSYCPDNAALDQWNEKLIQIAREESQHMSQVHKLLLRRGFSLSKHHKNKYANDLYVHVRKGQTPQEQVDRLLLTALIEARSCERFALLKDAANDADLKMLYSKLYTSEFSHYETYLQLAYLLQPRAQVDRRWQQWLQIESQVIQRQSPGFGIHSGEAVTA